MMEKKERMRLGVASEKARKEIRVKFKAAGRPCKTCELVAKNGPLNNAWGVCSDPKGEIYTRFYYCNECGACMGEV